MPDRSDDRNVRLTIRTTQDTKRRLARAAAHHGMTLSKYIKMCAVLHMQDNNLWGLKGAPNRRDPKYGRQTKTEIHKMKDPDDQEK